MLWMMMAAALASEPTSEPSLLDQARLNARWQLDEDSTQRTEDAALLRQTLDRYSQAAAGIFIGEVVGVYHPGGHAVQGTRVTLIVSEVIRGAPPSVVEVHVPPGGSYVDGDPDTAPVAIHSGYQMLVFVDEHGSTVASNALFLVDGGFIWRNKVPGVFLNPRIAGAWDLSDPSQDYLMASLPTVKEQLRR